MVGYGAVLCCAMLCCAVEGLLGFTDTGTLAYSGFQESLLFSRGAEDWFS